MLCCWRKIQTASEAPGVVGEPQTKAEGDDAAGGGAMGGDAGGDVRGGDVRDGAEDAGERGGEATNEGSAGGDKDQNRVWDPGGRLSREAAAQRSGTGSGGARPPETRTSTALCVQIESKGV